VLSLLKSFIESGNYGPGMVLPTERELAAKLGVGRPAIRESIKALTILDVLESRRGDGTYVKALDGLREGWPTKVALSTKDFSMLDLLEVRKMIEPKAAKLAASRATEAHLRRIEAQSIKVREATDWKSVAEHDLLLHTAIIEASGNPILQELNSALTRLLHRSREISAAGAPDRTQMLDSHSRIVDAILKGDGDEAEQAMLEHLHRVGLDLIRYQPVLKPFEIADQNEALQHLVTLAHPMMQEVSDMTGQSCHLAMPSNGNIVVVASVEASVQMGFSVHVGANVDLLNTASGHVILAFRDDEYRRHALAAWQKKTQAHLPAGLDRHLAAIRQRGYEELASYQVHSVVNISFPVLNQHGEAVAALCVPFLARIGDESGPPQVKERLARAAEALSKAIGGGKAVAGKPRRLLK
jgi:DNA-binding FadR family transcriptional regulator/DNA-binding IclR family transcriptional regulator